MLAPCSRSPRARAAIDAQGSGSCPPASKPTLTGPAFASSAARAPGTGPTPASSSGTPPAVSETKEAPRARSRGPIARAAAPSSSSPRASVRALSWRCVSICAGGGETVSKRRSPASTKSRFGSVWRSLRTSATARGKPPRWSGEQPQGTSWPATEAEKSSVSRSDGALWACLAGSGCAAGGFGAAQATAIATRSTRTGPNCYQSAEAGNRPKFLRDLAAGSVRR